MINGKRESFVRIAGIAVLTIGVVVLVGWVFNIPAVRSLCPNSPPMMPESAIGFILSGFALFLKSRFRNSYLTTYSSIAALLVFISGLISCLVMIFGLNSRIYDFFIKPQEYDSFHIEFMSMYSAISFMLAGFALFPKQGGRLTEEVRFWAIFLYALYSFQKICFYLLGSLFLPEFHHFTPLSLPSAIAFSVLSIGSFAAFPYSFYIKKILESGTGGRFLRRALPGALLFILTIHTINLYVVKSTFFQHYFASATMLTLEIGFSFVLLFLLAEWIDRINQNLIKSNKKLQNIFDSLVDVYYKADMEGKIIELSPSASKLVGWEIKDLIGTDILNVYFNPEDRKLLLEEIKKNGFVSNYEVILKDKEGNPVYVMVNSRLVKDEQDNPYIEGILHNITQIKQLQEKNQLLADTIQASLNEIYIFDDKTFHFRFLNLGAKRNLGYSEEEFLKMSPLDIKCKISKAEFEKMIDLLIKNPNETRVFEDLYRRKDGSVYPVEVHLQHIPQNNVFLAVINDITERRKTEDILRKSEKQFLDIMYASSDAIGLLGDDYRFFDCNESAAKMHGFENREALLKSHPGELSPPIQPDGTNSIEKANEMISLAFKKGFNRFEWVHRKSNGVDFLAEVSLTPIVFKGKRALYAVWRDLTVLKKTQEELRKRDMLLRMAGEISHFGGWSVEIPSYTLSWSDEVAAIHEEPAGFSPTVEKAINYYAPEYREKIKMVFNLCATEGAPYDEELEIITAKGNRRWVRTAGQAERDDKGNIIRVFGSIQDITEKKEAEISARENEEIFFHSFIYHSAVQLLLDPYDGRIIEANKAAFAFYGYEREKLLGMRIYEINTLPPEKLAKEIKRVTDEQTVRFEFKHRLSDGSIRDVEVFSSHIKSGRQDFLHSIIHDITDRKQAERNIELANKLLSEIVENLPIPIFLKDAMNLRFVLFNRAGEELLGYSKSDLLGKTDYDFFTKEEADFFTRKDREVLEKKEVLDIPEERITTRNKGLRLLHTKKIPILDENGEPQYLMGISEDITDKKRMEAELLNSQKMESIGVLAGGIAHDFNNMLTGITANLSLLLSKNPEESEIINDALSAAHAAQSLTAQLLSFSKGGKPVKKEVCLERLLREIFSLSLSGSDAGRETDIPDTLWSVECDETQIKQAIGNLLINAIQAMPAGGKVILKASNFDAIDPPSPMLPCGKYVRITISDTGIGIPEEHLSRIFDPYFTTKTKGHGLGLSMVWNVVRNHNGYIEVESKLGIGSTFTIFLPSTGRCLKELSTAEPHLKKGSGHILILEDDLIIQKALKRTLEKLGYSCKIATDGKNALDLFEKEKSAGNPFDVALLDLTIPGGMGGQETGIELRKRDPSLVIIISSGYSEKPVMADFKKEGFNAVLPKPYRSEDLSALLFRLLQKNKGNAN